MPGGGEEHAVEVTDREASHRYVKNFMREEEETRGRKLLHPEITVELRGEIVETTLAKKARGEGDGSGNDSNTHFAEVFKRALKSQGVDEEEAVKG